MVDGILYKATGDRYVEEADTSAASAKQHAPELTTALITDQTQVELPHIDLLLESDRDLEPDNSSNILYPDMSPFDRTIYLDTDTMIHDDISHLFNILDPNDIGVTLAPNLARVPTLPEPYRSFSGGILVFDTCPPVNRFFERWHDTYWEWREQSNITKNQPALSAALHESGLDIHVLPMEYNTFLSIGNSVGFLYFDCKISHGRPQSMLPQIVEELNQELGRRVYFVGPGIRSDYRLKILHFGGSSVFSKVLNALNSGGIRRGFSVAWTEIRGRE